MYSCKSHYRNFTPPFSIPDSWKWVRLEDIIRVKSGESLNVRELQSKDRFPIYGGNGINGYYDKYNVEKDTIIIGRVGFYCGSIHKTKSESWVTDNALIVDSYPTNIDTDWLCLTLIWSNLRKTSNSTAQPVVSGKSIYPIYVPLPPKSEQHRIVNTFDVFINAIGIIEIGKNSIQDLIQLTKSKILDLAMQGKLVPQDPTDETAADMLRRINPKAKIITDKPHYRAIPKNWVCASMTDICHTALGKTLNKATDKGQLENYLCAINVKDGYFDLSTIKKTKILPEEFERYSIYKGDLLVCEGGDVGRCAIWQGDRIFYQNALHRIRPLMGIEQKFLQYFLLHSKNKHWIDALCSGVTIKHFTTKAMSNLIIVIPPNNEQKRIIAKIESLFKLLDEIEMAMKIK